ncbi:hypothetical protein CFREI_11105 [Corynebacterium freiburgense]|nr:hypothetical protein CFREI_11105 [Corynebacterium freiburgense]
MCQFYLHCAGGFGLGSVWAGPAWASRRLVAQCWLPGDCRLIHHLVCNWCVWRQLSPGWVKMNSENEQLHLAFCVAVRAVMSCHHIPSNSPPPTRTPTHSSQSGRQISSSTFQCSGVISLAGETDTAFAPPWAAAWRLARRSSGVMV